ITALPAEILVFIIDFLDCQSRADLRLVHAHLASSVWTVENRLAKQCVDVGVTLPPPSFVRAAAIMGYGVDYARIQAMNPFGINLRVWAKRTRMSKTLMTLFPALDPLRDGHGNIVRQEVMMYRIHPVCVRAAHNGMECEAKFVLELDLKKFGFTPEMLVANLIQFKVTVRGVKIGLKADLDFSGGLIFPDDYSNYVHFIASVKEDPYIPGWGTDVIHELRSPRYCDAELLERMILNFKLSFDFVIYGIDIRVSA
ncbi:hypothetical protein PFISCL1PPCAC_7930, partial [Pristionchus fissidentatus]